MATVETRTVKPAGGGDYTSLNAWDLAERQNLPSVDKIKIVEIYSSGNALTGNLVMNVGWTTDHDHYVIMRAASGHEHSEVWDESKAYFAASGAVDTISFGQSGKGLHVYLEKLQCESSWRNFAWNGSGLTNIDRCILWQKSISSIQPVLFARANVTVTNSFILNHSLLTDARAGIFCENSDPTFVRVYNCTIIGNGYALDTNHCQFYSENNYLKGSDAYAYTGGSGIYKGDNDATSNGDALNPALRDIEFIADNFVNATSGSEDIHILNTSALYNAGRDLSAYGIVDDLEGTPRPQYGSYDIGADELDEPSITGDPSIILFSMW